MLWTKRTLPTMNKFKGHFVNLIFPAFIFGAITGIFTAIIILLYKLAAKYVIAFSETSYGFLREKLYSSHRVDSAVFRCTIVCTHL